MAAAIEIEGLGKAYRRYASGADRVLEAASLGLVRRHAEFWALADVTATIARGESFGLVGANGAGKSTLLKLLAGTTFPSKGRFRVHGRLGALLELGAGFHLELSGRENLALAGALLGLSRRELREKEGAILDFAELGEFVDAPVRTYSTGMAVRLSFALATTIDPDVLIIDEVLAVGDLYFQKKCVDRVLDFQRRGKTIVFCSHSLYDVRNLCARAAWLDRGRVRALGDAVGVTNDYATFERELGEASPGERSTSATAPPAGLPRVLAAQCVRPGGEPVRELAAGETLAVRVWWENPEPARFPLQLGLGFLRQDKTLVAAAATHVDGVSVDPRSGGAVLEFDALPLLAGSFTVLVVLFDGDGVHRHHEFALPEPLVVRARTKELGLVRLPHRWRFAPLEAPPASAVSPAPRAPERSA
ncbi:MAG: ABC transporter ATP-binding protein [Planctomycetes bacterium]|nr:ABC transporter ATP-binding protein [Planctomycetota bacterium]